MYGVRERITKCEWRREKTLKFIVVFVKISHKTIKKAHKLLAYSLFRSRIKKNTKLLFLSQFVYLKLLHLQQHWTDPIISIIKAMRLADILMVATYAQRHPYLRGDHCWKYATRWGNSLIISHWDMRDFLARIESPPADTATSLAEITLLRWPRLNA